MPSLQDGTERELLFYQYFVPDGTGTKGLILYGTRFFT